MTNTSGFTKAEVIKHQKAINKLISDYAKNCGLDVQTANVVYDQKEMKFNGIKLIVPGVSSPMDNIYSSQLGYEKGSLIGKTFVHMGEIFTVTELKPRNKMPIIAKKGNSSYRFHKDIVKNIN